MLHRVVVPILISLAAAIGAFALPAVATADVTPTIALNESAGSGGGTTSAIGFDLGFNSAPASDSVKSIALDLPTGVWINEEIDGGACLAAPAPAPACQIGSGTMTLGGPSSAPTPMAAYLINPERTGDIAGVEFVAGAMIAVGDLTVKSSSSLGINPSVGIFEEITWSDLPAAPAISAMDLTLSGLTMPSSCLPGTAAVSTTSQQQDTLPARATFPFVVTACNLLQYSPTITTVAVSRYVGSVAGSFEVVLSNPPGNAATQELKFYVPPNILPNPQLIPCLNGVSCTLGTVTMASPILPAGQTTGTIGVEGTVRSLTFPVKFPALGIEIDASWGTSFGGPLITLSNLPDLPITTLTLDFIGNSIGGAFAIECYPTQVQAGATSWTGLPGIDLSATTSLSGCAHSGKLTQTAPQATAYVAGLKSGSPRISVAAAKGKNAPPIKSVAISLPHGLLFSDKALRGSRVSNKALAVAGATIERASLHKGTLVLTFSQATSKSTLTLGGPLLTESSALHQEISARVAGSSHLTVRITDSSGKQTELTVQLKVKS